MRRAITIGIDAAGKASIIHGPEVPYADQRAAFANDRALKESAHWSEVLFASEFKRVAMRLKKPEPPASKLKK